jgi:hypothetical protein
MGALAEYALETVFPHLSPRLLPHPEALEPVRTLIDERQLGRSEVVREIANPKQS